MKKFISKYRYWIGGVIALFFLSLLFRGCKDDVVNYVYEKPNKQIDSIEQRLEVVRDSVRTLTLDKKESARIIEKLNKSLSKIDSEKLKKDNERIKNNIDTDSSSTVQIVDYWTKQFGNN